MRLLVPDERNAAENRAVGPCDHLPEALSPPRLELFANLAVDKRPVVFVAQALIPLGRGRGNNHK